MKELGTLKGPGIQIELASDTPIFCRPYRYSDIERDVIWSKTLDLLEAGLVEILHGEYASATVMPTKKDIHGNYTDRRMYGYYCPINWITKSDKYAMPTLEEIFDAVFKRLRTHGLRLHLGKCKFFQEQVEYLGHVIYPGGLGMQQTKVLAITLIPRPTDVSRIQAFVGLANYYRRYVKGFSQIMKPLTSLLKVDQELHWGEKQERAFQELKAQLTSAFILRRPVRGRPYQLHTDWSMLGLRAMLTQQDEQNEFVVAFASRSNNAAKSRYSSYEGECLTVMWALAHFQCYLFGTPFTLVTDHQPLKWLMESSKLIGKLAHWALILQEYDFQVVHRARVANLDADGLIRNPCTSQQDVTRARWHDEVDEEMVLGWHASALLYPLLGVGSTRGRTVALYSSQGVDVGPSYPLGDPEDGGGDTDERDVHHDQMVLEFLRTSIVLGLASAKEKDRVFQRAKRASFNAPTP
ncbi:unnamed protein product [Calypogeia fissa]